MRCGHPVIGTHQLPSSLDKVCHPLLPYPMTVWIHIKLPYFLVLKPPLHQLEILSCIFFLSIFLSLCVLCPDLLRNFLWWLARTSVLVCYLTLVNYRLLQFRRAFHDASALHVTFYSLGLQLVMKMVVLIMVLIPWIFVKPSYRDLTAIPGVHWLSRCSQSILNP